MDGHRTAAPVIACFPDVNERTAEADVGTSKRDTLLVSTGRLISQAMSAKLLAGTILFLMVGAVLPYHLCIGKSSQSSALPAADSVVAGEPKPGGNAAKASGATVVASRPAVRVVAAKDSSPAPAMLPPAPDVKSKSLVATPPSAPLATPWSAAAVRPAEYQDEIRTGSLQGNDQKTRR